MKLKSCIAAALAGLTASGALAGELRLTIHDVRSDQGRVMVALHDGAATFLTEQRRDGQALAARPGAMEAVFAGLPAGRYGVAVYHDENGNGRLDCNLVGVPNEGFGFGNNAVGIMGPPGFDAATITIGEGVTVSALTLRY